MIHKHSYAQAKLRETIYSLAIGPGDIRKRLVLAYHGFFTLKNEHFPEKLQPDWEWIQKELKKYDPIKRDDGSIFKGSVEHTCLMIKNKTGVKIAKKLLELFLKLEYENQAH